jgi:hypothetical protein
MLVAKIRKKDNHRAMVAQVERLMRSRLGSVGAIVQRHIVLNLTRGKTRVDGPSKPGEFPHVDTGKLRQGIHWEYIDDGRSMGVRIGTFFKYGLYLEVGTRHMAPRPYMRPTVMECRPTIARALRGQLMRGPKSV